MSMFGTIPTSAKPPVRPLNADNSRSIALRALGFVAADRGYLDRFLASAGISTGELSRQPTSPAHLAAILDFIIDNELILLRFSRTIDASLESVYEARRLIRGEPNRDRNGPIFSRTTRPLGAQLFADTDRVS